MANAKIDVVSPNDVELIASLYNQVFKPGRDAEFFRRRLLGRYNPLLLIASLDGTAVGFFVGFELKPTVFFAWLYGIMPQQRRIGLASQLMDAAHSWAREHGYASIRMECHNKHRAMLHLGIERMYDIVGIRWDADRADNLVILEKMLEEEQ